MGRKLKILFPALVALILMSSALYAEPFKSPNAGGTTGGFSLPNANTGWEGNKFAVDSAFHMIMLDSYIPKVSFQIIGQIELGAAMDIQPDDNGSDLLMFFKWRFYGSKSSALAIGGNFQWLDFDADGNEPYSGGQVYLVATYRAPFFKMPSETSLSVGYTFVEPVKNYHGIDFGMLFDLDFFPKVFKHYLHFMVEFGNYTYSIEGAGAETGRGIFNLGLRAAFLRTKRMKLNLDVWSTDMLDNNIGIATGLAFGFNF